MFPEIPKRDDCSFTGQSRRRAKPPKSTTAQSPKSYLEVSRVNSGKAYFKRFCDCVTADSATWLLSKGTIQETDRRNMAVNIEIKSRQILR
jgi:hypothetical protein